MYFNTSTLADIRKDKIIKLTEKNKEKHTSYTQVNSTLPKEGLTRAYVSFRPMRRIATVGDFNF